MAYPDDEYDEAIIVDLVDDAVVADPHSICTIVALEGNARWRTRLVRQEVDRSPNSLLLTSGQTGE